VRVESCEPETERKEVQTVVKPRNEPLMRGVSQSETKLQSQLELTMKLIANKTARQLHQLNS